MQHILVVDDDPDIRELIVQTLEDEGYTIRAFDEGAKALDAMREEPPALVLLDLMMPTMSGWEVAQIVRAEEVIADVPIILVSASRELGEAIASLAVNGSLAKPFDLDELISTVQKYVQKAPADIS